MNNYLDNLQFKIDWLHGVLPFSNVSALFDGLSNNVHKDFKLENWVYSGRNRFNYSHAFYFRGDSSITIAFNPDFESEFCSYYCDIPLISVDNGFNPNIFIQFTGRGLDIVREMCHNNLQKLFNYLGRERLNCSRIDIACDIFDSSNDLVPTVWNAFSHAVRPLKNKPTIKSRMSRTTGKGGNINRNVFEDMFRDGYVKNVSFGDHGSSCGMFRMYDKYHEQLCLKNEIPLEAFKSQYWYRLEYEIHNGKMKKYAQSLFNDIARFGLALPQAFSYVANLLFSIVDFKYMNLGSNELNSIWNKFISHNIHFVQFSQPFFQKPKSHTLETFKRYIHHNEKSIYFIFMLFAYDKEFRDLVLENGKKKIEKDNSFRYLALKNLPFMCA